MTRSVFLPAYQKMLQILIQTRKEAHVTQMELATRLHAPQSYVSKYESGDRRLDLVEFLQICRALEADPIPILEAVSQDLD